MNGCYQEIKIPTGAAPKVSYDATIAIVGSWLESPSAFNPGNHPYYSFKVNTCTMLTKGYITEIPELEKPGKIVDKLDIMVIQLLA